MEKTTVYLPAALKRALARAAAARGQSEAQLIREALGAATARQESPRPRLPLFDSGKTGLAEVQAAKDVIQRYRDLRIGIADASIAVLAQRHGARDVLTLNERHFRSMRIGRAKRFRIMPADQKA